MGQGYWILVWDKWGGGLVMVNPRLHTEGEDLHGNPKNWWSCSADIEDDDLAASHKLFDLYGEYYKIIRD